MPRPIGTIPIPPGRIEQPDRVRVQVEEVDILDAYRTSITRRGPIAHRRFRVTNLDGPSAAIGWSALWAAGIPRLNELHPYIQGLPVARLDQTVIEASPSQSWVDVTYNYFDDTAYFLNPPSEDAPPELEILNGIRTRQTYKDAQNNLLTLAIRALDSEGNIDPERELEWIEHVDVDDAQMVIRFRRREPTNPMHKSREYVGTINSVPIGPFLRHQWMCTRIDGVSDDRGLTFNVTYEFAYRPVTWNLDLIASAPDTGEVITPDHPRYIVKDI